MLRRLFLLFTLPVLMICLTGCSLYYTDDDPAEEPAYAVPVSEPLFLPDFAVQTIDGGTFRFSDELETHELVLINLFATWCGPCGMEFPYLQEAWQQRSGKVAVIAISVEPDDSDDVLRQYAERMGLTFPIAGGTDTYLGQFVTRGIPTTVLADRTGKVVMLEVGAQTSAQAFLELFDRFTGEDYDPDISVYEVYAYDSSYMPVEGAELEFCQDKFRASVVTDEYGYAVFKGPPAGYQVRIVNAPEGLQIPEPSEFYTLPFYQTFWIPFAETGS